MSADATRRYLLGLIGIVAAIGIWLLLSFNSTDVFFPPLQKMIVRAVQFWASPEGLSGIRATLSNYFLGLCIGIVLGTLLGFVFGQIEILNMAFMPIIEFAKSLPTPALLPIAIAMFGIGEDMKVAVIAFGTAFPVLINIITGIQNLPKQWIDTATVYSLTPIQKQINVIIPATIPHILAGIEIAIPFALVMAVISELIGQNTGIGGTIVNAQYTFEVDLMWSGVLLLGVIGWALSFLFACLEATVRTTLAVERE